MKKALVLAVMLMFVCGLAAAKPLSLRVGGGLDFPEEGMKMGFHGMGGVDYSISPTLSILGTVSYTSLPIDDMGLDLDLDPFTIIGVDAAAKYKFGSNPAAVPYVLGGLGFASSSMTVKMPEISYGGIVISPASEETVSSTDVAITLGAGVEIGTLFVELTYKMIDDLSIIPISVGVKF